MTENEKKPPPCFGVLDTVFPKDENGFRNTPAACLRCPQKIPCLKSAMNSPSGLKVREEMVDRAYGSGMIGFLERWSEKKNLQRKMKRGLKKSGDR